MHAIYGATVHVNVGWIDVTNQLSGRGFTIVKMERMDEQSLPQFEYFSWISSTCGRKLPSYSLLFSTIPQSLSSVHDVLLLIKLFDSLVPCCGNDDKKFLQLVESRKGCFLNTLGILLCIPPIMRMIIYSLYLVCT